MKHVTIRDRDNIFRFVGKQRQNYQPLLMECEDGGGDLTSVNGAATAQYLESKIPNKALKKSPTLVKIDPVTTDTKASTVGY